MTRHLLGALVVALVALATSAPAAVAAPFYAVFIRDAGLGQGSTSILREDPAGTVADIRVELVREGEVLAEQGYDQLRGGPDAVRLQLDPLPGDELRFYEPPSAASPVARYVWPGRPELGPCPAGARRVDARLLPRGDAGTGYDGSSYPGGPEAFALTRGPLNTATLAFPRPLAAGERIELASERDYGAVRVYATTSRPVGACGPVVPPRPTANDGRVYPTAETRLVADDRDPRFLLVEINVGCDRASRIPCRGKLRLETAAQPTTWAGESLFVLERGEVAPVAVELLGEVPFLENPGGVRLGAELVTHDTIGRPVVQRRTYVVVRPPGWPPTR